MVTRPSRAEWGGVASLTVSGPGRPDWGGRTEVWHGAPGWHGGAEVRSAVLWQGEPAHVVDPGGWRCGWYGGVVVGGPPVEVVCRRRRWHDEFYVSLSDPFVAIGAEVVWSPGADFAVVAYADREVICAPASPEVVVVEDGIYYPDHWTAPPVVVERELYVPVQPVSAGLGLAVNWNSNAGTSVSGGLFFSTMW